MVNSSISRRSFHRFLGQNMLALSLAGFLRHTAMADDQGQESLDEWFRSYSQLGRKLASGELKQDAWQDGMGELFESLSLPALMKRIDFKRLSPQLQKTELGKRGEIFHTLLVDGAGAPGTGPEPKQVLITKLAYIKKGRSVPPHGHFNMVSAFLNIHSSISAASVCDTPWHQSSSKKERVRRYSTATVPRRNAEGKEPGRSIKAKVRVLHEAFR